MIFSYFRKRRESAEREQNAENKIAAMAEPSEDEIRAKLAYFYSSEHVEHCQPWIRKIPQNEWIERQIAQRKYREVAQ